MNDFDVSAFMICKNEEPVIERALKSLKWADELVIVDGFSTDNTVEICKQYTDGIHQREWTNFGEQRNFALSLLTRPWVFFLDADEVCSEGLIRWFGDFKIHGPSGMRGTVMPSPSQHLNGRPGLGRIDLFEIRRLEHFQGRLYKFGANNPSHQWRFFRREGAQFIGEVHEYPQVEGRIMRLEAPIYHYPRANLTQIVDKMNRYSTLEAEKLFSRGVKRPAPYMFFSGFAMFLKAYFRKQGFRDGVLGFILAVMDGGAFFLRQAKLYLKNKETRRI